MVLCLSLADGEVAGCYRLLQLLTQCEAGNTAQGRYCECVYASADIHGSMSHARGLGWQTWGVASTVPCLTSMASCWVPATESLLVQQNNMACYYVNLMTCGFPAMTVTVVLA